MERRQFLNSIFSLTGLAVVGSQTNLHALLTCTPFNYNGIQQCEAGIDSNLANISAAATNGQHMNQWCWAASIEMVFRYYGFNINQESIVTQTWGEIANLPAQPNQILSNLNRHWIDNYGRNFRVKGDNRSANHITAAQDLSNNMPLIIGTMGHAMVLTSLVYLRNPLGNGRVISAIVRDPWPGRGRRILSIQEWNNISFLVRIRLQRL